MVDRTRSRSSRKNSGEADRLADTTLDGVLDAWPGVPPRPARTPLEAARLVLIDTPGQVHRLSGRYSDVGRAAKTAQAFRRAKPSTLSPTATGTFDARAFFDPEEHQWRVAARYLPAPDDHGDRM